MLSFLGALGGFLSQLLSWLNTKQVLDSGKAEQKQEDLQEVVNAVSKAKSVDTPNTSRDARLQSMFDRASTPSK